MRLRAAIKEAAVTVSGMDKRRRLRVKDLTGSLCALFALSLTASLGAFADTTLDVLDGFGFPLGTVVIGVDFASTSQAVGVNFKVGFDQHKLQFLDAEEGPSASAADKDVEAETPSEGTVSVVVFGLNNNVIASGRLVNLRFAILGTASPGQTLALVGSTPASTDTHADPISTSISDGTILVTQCTSPSAPGNVSATDGAYSDHVRITWSAANGATTYAIYRSSSNSFSSAALLAVTASTLYDDYAASPASLTSSGGCGASSVVSFASYYYWVKSQNVCGVSSVAGPDSGYRGSSKSSASGVTFEPVLPAQSKEVEIAVDDTLAIRLQADDRIESVWGRVSADGFEDSAVEWVPVEGAEGRDGWVVYRPSVLWLPGEIVTMMAGGATASGTVIGPLTYAFSARPADSPSFSTDSSKSVVSQPSLDQVEAKNLLRSDESHDAQVYAVDAAALPELPDSVGDVFRIAPGGPYANPQRVWLPLPNGVSPDAVTPFYYQGTSSEGTWYPGSNVTGWLVEGSELTLRQGGVAYYGFLVNHGGILRLGVREDSLDISRASLAPDAGVGTGPIENLFLLAGVVLILSISNRVSQRRKNRYPSAN